MWDEFETALLIESVKTKKPPFKVFKALSVLFDQFFMFALFQINCRFSSLLKKFGKKKADK
jgi:hypothetical protein